MRLLKFFVFSILTLCLVAAPALADKDSKQEVLPANEEQAGLPRALIIGDSVCLGYTPQLAEMLKGQVNLYRTRKNAGSTVRGVEKIGDWLGEGKWDVIHFNWGIQDMIAGADGKLQAEPEVYEKNLREIVAKLKASGANLIWGTITPIPKGFGDVPRYNAIAARIMAENHIPTDDLFTAVEPRVEQLRLPQNVHYTPEGYGFLARQVAASILGALPAKK